MVTIHYIFHKKIIYENGSYKCLAVKEPIKMPNGDWIDLRCAEDTFFRKGEYKKIPLGLSVLLPKGYCAVVAPRSSLFEKTGLLCPNSIAIIDNSFCGATDEWNFIAYATRDIKIEYNQRICQFTIFPVEQDIEFKYSPELFEKRPPRGGIGSTGDF